MTKGDDTLQTPSSFVIVTKPKGIRMIFPFDGKPNIYVTKGH